MAAAARGGLERLSTCRALLGPSQGTAWEGGVPMGSMTAAVALGRGRQVAQRLKEAGATVKEGRRQGRRPIRVDPEPCGGRGRCRGL